MGNLATSRLLHPSLRLMLAALFIAAAFVADPALVLPALLLAAALGDGAQRKRWRNLVWRSRWLMLAILLAVGLTEPGQHFFPGFPGTREGLMAAGSQLLRILASLLVVAWLLAADKSELTAAVLGIGMVLGRRVQPSVGHLAVRLVMVIELVEDRRLHWVDLLSGTIDASPRGALSVTLSEWTPRDRHVLVSAVIALAMLLAMGG